jgi:hypothetical protein
MNPQCATCGEFYNPENMVKIVLINGEYIRICKHCLYTLNRTKAGVEINLHKKERIECLTN